ncbi:hypothetical protein Tco_1346376 [Tanacetum coccineum]
MLNFGEQVQNSWGYNSFNWSLDWGRFPLGVSGPSSQLKFYGSFGLQVHLGFHLLMMVLGASGSPPCGCVVNPLVEFLALVMADEIKHRSSYESKELPGFAIGEQSTYHIEYIFASRSTMWKVELQ